MDELKKLKIIGFKIIEIFWYTVVNYSEHVTVMSCVKVILNNYHPVKPCIKEFCTVIYLISLTTGLISRYQS